MEKITRIVKDSNELKSIIQIILDEYSNNDNINIDLLDIDFLEDGTIKLDIPMKKREENDNFQRLFVTYITDDGKPNTLYTLLALPIQLHHLQELENNVNSLVSELYSPSEGWKSTGFSFIKLTNHEVLLQSTVQKPFTNIKTK